MPSGHQRPIKILPLKEYKFRMGIAKHDLVRKAT